MGRESRQLHAFVQSTNSIFLCPQKPKCESQQNVNEIATIPATSTHPRGDPVLAVRRQLSQLLSFYGLGTGKMDGQSHGRLRLTIGNFVSASADHRPKGMLWIPFQIYTIFDEYTREAIDQRCSRCGGNLAISLESLKSILSHREPVTAQKTSVKPHFYCERDFSAPIMTGSSGALLLTTWRCAFRRVPRTCSCIFNLMARFKMGWL